MKLSQKEKCRSNEKHAKKCFDYSRFSTYSHVLITTIPAMSSPWTTRTRNRRPVRKKKSLSSRVPGLHTSCSRQLQEHNHQIQFTVHTIYVIAGKKQVITVLSVTSTIAKDLIEAPLLQTELYDITENKFTLQKPSHLPSWQWCHRYECC